MISVHRITNHRHGPAGLQAGMDIYIYIYIYIICIQLVYTTDTVLLGYGSVCHNSTFVRLLLVYQFIINLNLTVNILLSSFKSFLGKYSIICIFIQTNHFNTRAIFMSFILQLINFSNFLT